MGSPIKNIDRIGFNTRIVHASPGENTATDLAHRAKPTTSEIQLIAKDYVGEVDIPYNVLTDSLERGNFETRIMKHIGTRVGIDLAEFALAGDTLSADPDLAVQDGWLKLAATHVVDAAGGTVDDTVLSRLYKAVPDKYLENDLGWCIYLQRAVAIDWRSSVAGRMTIGGDKALQESGIPAFFGIPVKKDNTIKVDPTTGYTKGLFIHPQNLVVGIWKEITIETWRDIKRRQLVVTVHLRSAFQIEQPDACSLLINVAPAL
jgi:hypothetical protein